MACACVFPAASSLQAVHAGKQRAIERVLKQRRRSSSGGAVVSRWKVASCSTAPPAIMAAQRGRRTPPPAHRRIASRRGHIQHTTDEPPAMRDLRLATRCSPLCGGSIHRQTASTGAARCEHGEGREQARASARACQPLAEHYAAAPSGAPYSRDASPLLPTPRPWRRRGSMRALSWQRP